MKKKPTAQEIAITHGWRREGKTTRYTHKKFPMVALIIQPSGEWEVPHKAKGKTCRTLLDFLTKFHQTTFHGMTANKLVKEPKKEPKQAKHDLTNMTPRIEEGYFLQGPVKFAVDTEDLFKTLSCGAFGVGQMRAREGILANLGETELKRWAEVNGLPTKPFAKELLIEVLRCPLQDAWFKACYDPAVQPGIHDNPEKRAANYTARKQAFNERFQAYTEQAQVKAERLKNSISSGNGSTRHVFAKQPESTWQRTEKLTKKIVAEVKGQQRPILEWLLSHTGTKSEIASAIAKALTTKQKPELVVGHYLPEWKKRGWITQCV